MAKGNGKNGGNNMYKPIPDKNFRDKKFNQDKNYFSQGIAQCGKDFLDRKRPDELYRDAPRVLRELARGKFNIPEYAPYVAHSGLLNTMITYANEQLQEATIIYQAINQSITIQSTSSAQPASAAQVIVFQKYKNRMDVYTIIYSYLFNFSQTYELGLLVSLSQNINKFSDFI